MCVRYFIAIWEKDSISLWILELGICRSWRSLTVVVCIVPLIPAVIIMGGSTIHPSWDKSGWRMAYLSSFRLVASTGNLSLQYVNSNICTLRFGLGVKGGLSVGGTPRMHNISGLSRAGHLHLGR
jgi:hypothetical protein